MLVFIELQTRIVLWGAKVNLHGLVGLLPSYSAIRVGSASYVQPPGHLKRVG